ncbi:hypothetical protein [Saccharicrinis sp. FJH54]|uniref:hypothetical protein n=1 Tax=Saccharicrinis sp. FJH54 TaxID=3344665 RepID=UPI0035D4BE1B
MKLYIKCSECKKEISFWTWSPEKVDLKMIHGDKIELKCKSCNSIKKYYIDNLRAKKSKIALLMASSIFILGTPITLILLWDYIWQSGLYGAFVLILIIGIPSTIYGIINKNDSQRVSLFNRS